MASAPLNLISCSRTRVFRGIDGMLRNAASLRRINAQFKSYTGLITDVEEFPQTIPVGITLNMEQTSVGWYSPDAAQLTLIVSVDIEIQSLILEDLINLWYAIEQVFYPATNPANSPPNTDRLKVQSYLQSLGARTGVMTFQAPGMPKIDGGRMYARGMIKIDTYDLLDP